MGDEVVDEDNGLHYRVTYAHAYIASNALQSTGVHIMGRRMWRTGRKAGREAINDSSISSRCVKVK